MILSIAFGLSNRFSLFYCCLGGEAGLAEPPQPDAPPQPLAPFTGGAESGCGFFMAPPQPLVPLASCLAHFGHFFMPPQPVGPDSEAGLPFSAGAAGVVSATETDAMPAMSVVILSPASSVRMG